VDGTVIERMLEPRQARHRSGALSAQETKPRSSYVTKRPLVFGEPTPAHESFRSATGPGEPHALIDAMNAAARADERAAGCEALIGRRIRQGLMATFITPSR
jgi:hypothetical protein